MSTIDLVYYRHYTIFPILTHLSDLDKINLRNLLKNKFWKFCEKENAIGLNRFKFYNCNLIFNQFIKIVNWLNNKNYYLCGKFYYRTNRSIHLIMVPNKNNCISYFTMNDIIDEVVINPHNIDKLIREASYKIDEFAGSENILSKVGDFITDHRVISFLCGCLVGKYIYSYYF